MMRFASPWMLLLLLPALAAAWHFARRRATGDARLPLPRAEDGMRLAAGPWVRIDRAIPWVRCAILVLLVLALARPQSGASLESVSSLGVDIVVAMDISGSMRAEDFQPDNRLAVAKRTVRQFVDGRPGDRIGLVVFASVAATRCPLTLDHPMLRQFLEEVDFAPEEQQQTAIGLGLATAVNRLRESEAKSKVVVLLTDGENNAGQIGPSAAAEAARALGIKVHTVGVGSDGPVPYPIRRGNRVERQAIEFNLDEELLQEISAATGGEAFLATDADALARIFERIDALEKTEVESRVRVVYSEAFHWALFPALALLLVERFLLATRLRRIP